MKIPKPSMPKSKIISSEIKFSPRNLYGVKFYISKDPDAHNLSVIEREGIFYIRIWENGQWNFPSGYSWETAIDGFSTLKAAGHWLSQRDWKNANSNKIDIDEQFNENHKSEFIEAMELFGFRRSEDSFYKNDLVYVYEEQKTEDILDGDIQIRVIYYEEGPHVTYWVNSKRVGEYASPNVAQSINHIERTLKKYGYSDLITAGFAPQSNRNKIMAAINTRNLAKNLVRVRSSNVWAYCINIREYGDKTGDVLAQFKANNGGPGDIYIYYNVPVNLWRKWVSASSKGHFFWKHIRNTFKYSKLTGNRRGVLPNAIN
jgi:hypothetical protein